MTKEITKNLTTAQEENFLRIINLPELRAGTQRNWDKIREYMKDRRQDKEDGIGIFRQLEHKDMERLRVKLRDRNNKTEKPVIPLTLEQGKAVVEKVREELNNFTEDKKKFPWPAKSQAICRLCNVPSEAPSNADQQRLCERTVKLWWYFNKHRLDDIAYPGDRNSRIVMTQPDMEQLFAFRIYTDFTISDLVKKLPSKPAVATGAHWIRRLESVLEQNQNKSVYKIYEKLAVRRKRKDEVNQQVPMDLSNVRLTLRLPPPKAAKLSDCSTHSLRHIYDSFQAREISSDVLDEETRTAISGELKRRPWVDSGMGKEKQKGKDKDKHGKGHEKHGKGHEKHGERDEKHGKEHEKHGEREKGKKRNDGNVTEEEEDRHKTKRVANAETPSSGKHANRRQSGSHRGSSTPNDAQQSSKDRASRHGTPAQPPSVASTSVAPVASSSRANPSAPSEPKENEKLKEDMEHEKLWHRDPKDRRPLQFPCPGCNRPYKRYVEQLIEHVEGDRHGSMVKQRCRDDWGYYYQYVKRDWQTGEKLRSQSSGSGRS